MQKWTKKWRIYLNESKSAHVNFTNRRFEHIPVNVNNQMVPYANTTKYFGMTLWEARARACLNFIFCIGKERMPLSESVVVLYIASP
jgi:hypothetical protein